MNQPLEITLRTLTPLWTGGVDGTSDRLHATGIIGSLRWWYEAIVRGLGGDACDPSKHECSFDAEKYRKSQPADERLRLQDAGLCHVCQIFGATGWRRQFRLEVMDDNTSPAWNPPPNVLNIRPPDRNRGWYLPPGRMGQFRLRIRGEERVLNLLAALFLFLERWGNLGAKPQLGYGLFAIDKRAEVRERANKWQWAIMGSRAPDSDIPDLRRFGFFRYQFQPEKPGWWTQVPGMERIAVQAQPVVSTHKTVPLAPALKNEWRFHRWQGSQGDEKWMFGTLHWRQGNEMVRVRSKVTVSWAYPQDNGWEIRGWAWLQKPQIADNVWDLVRDEAGWQAVIPTPGNLETYPHGPWRVQSAEDVVHLLEEIK